MITVESLCRDYIDGGGRQWFRPRQPAKVTRALSDVSLSVSPGEVFGVLGPNGAGKTSLIKILATLLLPTAGRARVAGLDVVRQPQKVRERIALVLGSERNLYWKLTARENLEFFGALHHIRPADLRKRIGMVLQMVQLEQHAGQLVETFSRGMKQRLVLAKALLADAEVIFLDEPTNGLDPHSAQTIRGIVRDLSQRHGRTILLTTHFMHEAEELCHRLAILSQSRLLATGTPAQIKAMACQRRVVVLEASHHAPEAVVRWLLSVPGVAEVTSGESEGEGFLSYRVQVEEVSGETLARLLRSLDSRGVTVQAVRVEEPTLEEAFLCLTRPGLSAEGA